MEFLKNRISLVLASLVFLLAFVVFMLTTAPTVAFWDCGEYIAAGHSLGVPHPPGNPMFMLMLRFASIVFGFFNDVGYRMNVLVVLFSAATAVLLYLTAVRVGQTITGGLDTTWKKLAVYVGAVVAGTWGVFGSTFWFSAVEASECNPSMFFVALTAYLVVVWAQSTDPRRDRLLLLLAYTSFLGIGVHMYSAITLPAAFLFVLMVDVEKRYDWRLWLTCALLGTVVFDMFLFIRLGPAVTVGTFVMSRVDRKASDKWMLCFWLSLLAVIGFSSHLMAPIRSALNPMIDENHPATWTAFREFLERKQYGSESMFQRMFWRRGTFGHQFGIEGHMGYGGFHLTQFFNFSPLDTQRNFVAEDGGLGMAKLLAYLVPTALMFFAWWRLYKKDRNLALYLILVFVLSSIVLTLYMNFADGTRSEKRDYMYWLRSGKQGPQPLVHREVRVRDYFWTSAFMYLGMWVGVAATAIMHMLFTSRSSEVRKSAAPIAVVLFMAAPALPIAQNWNASTRAGDWVPWDYAYNLLMTCDKDGILFTNGDNDTFPLWALQEAYGVRKDVRIVNLSLLNTNWYIKQLKELEPKVPISFSQRQIDALSYDRNPLEKTTRYPLRRAGISVVLPGRDQMPAIRVQDKMVLNIVDATAWQKPVYFSVTVGEDCKMGLEPYLQMQGLAFRVMREPVPPSDQIDIPRTVHMLRNVYKYRALGDGGDPRDETLMQVLSSYTGTYMRLGLALRRPLGELKNRLTQLEKEPAADSAAALEAARKAYTDTLDLAVGLLDECVRLVNWDWRPRMLRHDLLMSHGRIEDAEKRAREALEMEPGNEQYRRMHAEAKSALGRRDTAPAIPQILPQ